MEVLVRMKAWTRRLQRSLAGLFRRQSRLATEQDMDEEMRAHVELRTQANIEQGMNPEEALFAALRQFGSRESIKEECREARGIMWLEGLSHEIALSARRLAATPGFTLVAVTSLAVGLALAATTLATVDAYLIRSLPYPSAERVYHVMYAPPGPWEPRGLASINWQSLNDVVQDCITTSGATFYLMDAGSVRTTRTLQVSPGFLTGLGVRATVGRTFTEEEFAPGAEGVTMISHAQWRDRFGSDPQMIGRQLQITRDEGGRSNETLRVVGVLPPGFWFGRDSSAQVDFLVPLRFRTQTYMVRLHKGVPVPYAEKRITEMVKSIGSDFRPDWTGVHLESTHARYVEKIQPVLLGITFAVGIVLVLVCTNVSVLLLLRALRRQKEIAVRLALGAGRTHIFRMLVSETALICGAALLLGLSLTAVMLRLLAPLIQSQLGRPAPGGSSAIRMDATVLLVMGGVGLLITAALALIPLLAPWQRRLADALRSQGANATDGPSMRQFRNALIALEVGGSLVLLVSCGLMIRSALNLMHADLGFDPQNVIRIGVRLPARTYADAGALHQFFIALADRLPHDPGSQMALVTAFPSFYPANKHDYEVGEAATGGASVGMQPVGAGYFSLYGVRLSQGREFTTDDRLGSEPVAIVSETLAQRLWPSESALGRRIRVVEGDMPQSPLGPWRTIVGVVGDIRQGYDDSDLSDLYLPFLQAPRRFASVHLRTRRSPTYWEQRIRAAARELDPYALVGTVTTIVSEDRQRRGTEFLTSMLSGFAGFSALLALLGIYGVTTYAVQQREREIAIRIAVGANRRAVIQMFLRAGVGVLATGLGIGLMGAFGAARILKNMVYGVPAFDVTTLISACALMAIAGLTAIWWPAQRAALRNPMTVLKEG